MKILIALLALFARPDVAFADAQIPTRDIATAKDPAVFGRYDGSFIVEYQSKAFDALKLPTSPLLQNDDDHRDAMNNHILLAEDNLTLEGKLTRAAYVLPDGRSPLELLRNYQQILTEKGGSVLFECAGEDCGGDAEAGASHGGGRSALIDSVYPKRAVISEDFSSGACAVNEDHVDQRYFVGKVEASGSTTHIAVLAYTLRDDLYCKALSDRTIALVVTLEAKAREQKMVAIKASEIAQSIAATGRIALYGIYFDTDKAEIKPESKPQLDEIAALLKSDPAIKLIVGGHTDNQGNAEHNLELSKRRAESVVAGIATRGVARDRLIAQGLGSGAPVASNDNDAGRAKNRRVELVEQ